MKSERAREREFDFSDEDFNALRSLVKKIAGINLADSKRELVYGRISRRLRVLGLNSFAQYRHVLEGRDSGELTEFCDAMTTNLTSFFREAHHFDYLRDEVLLRRAADSGSSRRIRMWSSACSSGEEPYSIAMTICEALPNWRQWDIKILATDLDSHMLARAQRGIYAADRLAGLAPKRLQQFFRPSTDEGAGAFEVTADLKSLITFKPINLMHPLPMPGPLDVIFCRNVVIYFDKDTQRELFSRIALVQRPDDLLFLGHSETLFKVSDQYGLIGKSMYRRA
jgi:chemotaxis protein methyltransferase CheR